MNKYREQFEKETGMIHDFEQRRQKRWFTNSYVEYLEQKLSSAEAEIERLRKPYKYKNFEEWCKTLPWHLQKRVEKNKMQALAIWEVSRQLSDQPKKYCPTCNNSDHSEICFECEDHDKYEPATEQGKGGKDEMD